MKTTLVTMIKLNIQTLARRGTHIQAYVDPMWSHHEGSMSIPRANLRWAHVDCRRRTHEVNVGDQHCAHVGPTYHCYLDFHSSVATKNSMSRIVGNIVMCDVPELLANHVECIKCPAGERHITAATYESIARKVGIFLPVGTGKFVLIEWV